MPCKRALTQYTTKKDSSLPQYYDWRTLGKVTSVKNQGHCGSCWAFSAVAAIESAYAIKTNILENFSEQQLVDCSTANNGCNGGLPVYGMEYVIEYGIMKYDDYPYIARVFSFNNIFILISKNLVDILQIMLLKFQMF